MFLYIKLATGQRPGFRPGRPHHGKRALHTWRVLGQLGLLAVNPSSIKRACARCLSTTATAVLQCASSTRTCENTESHKTGPAPEIASHVRMHSNHSLIANARFHCDKCTTFLHRSFAFPPPPEQSRLFTAEQNAPPIRPLAPDNDAVLSVEFLTFAKVGR